MKEDDNNWPEPDRVGRQELEIVMGNEHISFTTSKIGSLMDVQTSKDPEGLRIFYYLVQVTFKTCYVTYLVCENYCCFMCLRATNLAKRCDCAPTFSSYVSCIWLLWSPKPLRYLHTAGSLAFRLHHMPFSRNSISSNGKPNISG